MATSFDGKIKIVHQNYFTSVGPTTTKNSIQSDHQQQRYKKNKIFQYFTEKSHIVTMATLFEYLRAGFGKNHHQIQKIQYLCYRKSIISTGSPGCGAISLTKRFFGPESPH